MFSPATKEAANNTLSDAKATAYSAKRDLNKSADDKTTNLVEYAEKAGRDVRHFIDSTSEHLHSASDRVTDEIRNNPVRSSAIALGIGVMLGALIRR